jgi:CobW/HypB/UreG, nucleotide-binding domain
VQKNTTQTGLSSSLRKAPVPLSRSRRGTRGNLPARIASLTHCIFPTRSGSAFPATLAFQIRDLERETSRALTLDAIVTVIDAENFSGYEDTSITARMQAQYTDVLLIVSSPVPPRPLTHIAFLIPTERIE